MDEEQGRGIMEFEGERRSAETRGSSTATESMAQDISRSADKAKSNIAQAAESAKAEARRIANQQKEAGADRLGDFAGAVHGAARTLETGMPQMASYIHGAAAQLEGAAKTLRSRSIEDLVDGIGNFARTQPVIFFGGAVLAGFALTRFLKSSVQDADESWQQQADQGWQQAEQGWEQADMRGQ